MDPGSSRAGHGREASSEISSGRAGNHSSSSSRGGTRGLLKEIITPQKLGGKSGKPIDEFRCPICFETIKEAFVTKCGHSFCYLCISKHLEHKSQCPTCRKFLKRDAVFPNFLLNRLLEKKVRLEGEGGKDVKLKSLMNTIRHEGDWSVSEVNALLMTLVDKKRKMEIDEKEVEMDVLSDFLNRAKQQKEEQLSKLKTEISFLDEDLERVLEVKSEISGQRDGAEDAYLEQPPLKKIALSSSDAEPVPDLNSGTRNSDLIKKENGEEKPSSPDKPTSRTTLTESVAAKRRRVYTHFEDLENCYFDLRQKSSFCSDQNHSALNSFSECLSRITKFSKFTPLASLKYGDMFNSSSIVSSIEFDRDDEYFATAGVTKKIKVFEYNTVVHDPVDIHYPIKEMSCHSKISCLSWNTYIKSQIASSDYEGIVSLWDAYTGQSVIQFEEHTKRAWSVDFSKTDPTRLASGSDDTKVKIWSTNQENSVASIESKANICCVKFNPEVSHHLAFGSADHHIHYYDLRKLREPLFVLKGHRKAVSYVKFLDSDELVSASTDSTLKSWSVSRYECVRTFTGHTNEKNFVGLTANGDYIACGSENNSVYTYYKALSKPIVSYRFGSSNPVTGDENYEDVAQFVSSVCWKKDCNVLLAANSQGTIKVLDLS